MSISEFHEKFVFRIEPKPGGGYVSVSENPALVFEGATQEEVQQKALEKIEQLAGPALSGMLKEMDKPGGIGGMVDEKKFSIAIGRKTITKTWRASGNTLPGVLKDSAQAQLPQVTTERSVQSEGGLNATVKLLIAAAVLLFVLWLVYRR